MILSIKIRILLAENPKLPLSGIHVGLYDRDENDPDDFLAEGITNTNGETTLVFDSEKYMDAEDRDPWRIDSLPDLYILVYDQNGEIVLSTRQEGLINQIPKQMVISIREELARERGLI